ncbi:MAG: alpha/beta fold hydrolase [candidate division Zixibacteria bacterium]|nr:alpha/beta fold hydrolase [candidate division Zixibacteria bacterium]
MIFRWRMNCRAAVAAVLLIVSLSGASFGRDFRAKADRFMEALTTGQYDSAVAEFSPQVAAQLPANMLEQVWSGVVAQLGGLIEYTFTSSASSDTVTTYVYLAEFEKTNLTALVSFNPAGKINGFYFRPAEPSRQKKPSYRLPSYVDTAAFTEAEIAIPGASPVPATRVTVNIGRPAPVVLMVPGSGPNDRNETLFENQPFKDIAWGLGSMGVASIRFDNRSYVVGMQKTAGLDLNQYLMDDIASCLAYIRSEPTLFDTTRIFILGHSLGGVVAPIAAKRDGRLAGIIMMSATARPLTEVVVSQYKYLGSLEADSLQETVKGQIAAIEEACDKIRRRTFPKNELFVFASGQVWYDLSDNDNVAAAKGLTIPMLLLFGGRDYQVVDADREIWQKTLGDRGNVVIKRYDNLNHLYQPGVGMANNTEYMTNLAPVDGPVLIDIADWIQGLGR